MRVTGRTRPRSVASAAVSATPQPPPPHVRAAFGARGGEPEPFDGGPVWVCGDVALRPVINPAQAAWVASTLDALRVENLRLARPLRSTDGRWVVGGWTATRALTGVPQARHDDVVAVAMRLHEATAPLPRPRFLDARQDVFAVADRLAWGEDDISLDPDLGGRLFERLADARATMASKPQVVHGELFGNVLFDGSADPAITDLVPYWRPPQWAAAVAVIDALAWGGADDGIVSRWSHLPEWPQALVRAALFRVAGHALHPLSTGPSLRGLERAVERISAVL